MEVAAFLAGAGALTAALSLSSTAQRGRQERAEREFDQLASRAVVTAPYIGAGTAAEIEHVQVPHLRDYFDDLPSISK